MKRMKLPAKHAKKLFHKTAGHQHVHPKNTNPGATIMRGGYRL